jgi:hypothetical protein
MANRSGLILTAALVGLLSAPSWAAASAEPVATAPIPPPLSAAPPAASVPDKPAFINPMPPKPAPPKASAAPPATAPPKRPVRSAAKHEHDKRAAERHRPSRQAKKEKEKEQQHTVAHASPPTSPVRRPRPRLRYYAGDFPPPPPWYDGSFGYFAGPWRRPIIPW